jgi:hypothetical protein
MSEKTLMDKLSDVQYAEYALEHGVVEAFGGLDALWFDDWWFDTYDSSVELVNAKPGSEPTPEQLAALRVLGIRIAFVSYTDGVGKSWHWSDGGWASGPCSPRGSDENKKVLVREARARAQRLERALRGLYEHHQRISSPDTRWELPVYVEAREAMALSSPSGQECGTCRTKAAGLPTPGYSHAPGCPSGQEEVR